MSRPDLTDEAIDKKLFTTPEDMIGEVLDFGETKGRLTSILGSGAEGIVFEVTDVATGSTGLVAKFSRASFDPRMALNREIKDAMEHGDWDKILRFCDRLLMRIPDAEEAAFNKGMAHMVRHEFDAAASSFDLAISLSPRDLLNWTYKASASAKLGRTDEMLAALLTCEEIDARSFKEFLATTHKMAEEMRSALEAVPKKHAHYKPAQRVLKSLFGKRGFWG